MVRFLSCALTAFLGLIITMSNGQTYDTLLSLVGPDCANLEDSLPGTTVFGPTDDAFAEFLEETGLNATFLCGDGTDTLTDLLLYHVIDGTVLADDVLALPDTETSIATLQGSEIVVNNDDLTVNDVSIVQTDAVTDPYVLHGIEEVLTLPPTPTTPAESETTIAEPETTAPADDGPTFDTLLELVGPDCANLADALPGTTVFGPTDAAFAAFLDETGLDTEFLCGDGIDALTGTLLYHVVNGTFLADDVLALPDTETSIATLQGNDIVINKDDLTVNGVSIVQPDAVTDPYVLHGIEEVLAVPPTPTATAPEPDEPETTDGAAEASYDTVLTLVGPDCANLADALPGTTVFGPTDDAIAALLEETGLDADFLCGDGIDMLTETLLYHVVNGTFLAEDVLALPDTETSIPTLQGSAIVLNKDALTVNGVSIVQPDAVTDPYVLHGINAVLVVPTIATTTDAPPKTTGDAPETTEGGAATTVEDSTEAPPTTAEPTSSAAIVGSFGAVFGAVAFLAGL